MPILCALVGATGVGKTDLSLSLARRSGAEIISMDSRQLYTGFRIGTAQPSPSAIALVPHHLVDFLSPLSVYSVGDFVRDVRSLLSRFPERPFVLVGGTGLYLQGLSEGLAEIPRIDPEVREGCEKLSIEKGLDFVYEQVKSVDPESASRICLQDRQRLLRALEVFRQTGKKYSEIRRERRGGIGKIRTFLLDRDRTTLYKMINARVIGMVENGWIDEVQALSGTVPVEAPAWQSLGYREWLAYIKGKMPRECVMERIQTGTRHYAKRQITWFRHQTEAETLDLNEGNEKILEKIQREIKNNLPK